MGLISRYYLKFRNRLIGAPGEYSLENRIFNAASLFGLIASLMATIINFILFIYFGLTLLTVLSFFVFAIFYYLAKKKKYYKDLIAPFIFISLLMLSMIWFVNSGIDGPVIQFFFLGAIIFISLAKGKLRWIAILSIILLLSGIFYIDFTNPDMVMSYSTRLTRYIDVFSTAVVILVIIASMTAFILKSYYEEQEITNAQKDKILEQNKVLQKKEQELLEIKSKLEEQVEFRTKELILANEQLEKAISRAREADQLKSSFLSNMSHEIRTPLNAILGFADLLKEENNSDKVKEYIDIISNKGFLLLNIINDIIDLSKVESGELSIKHLDFSIDHTLSEIFFSFKKLLPEKKKDRIEFTYLKPENAENFFMHNDPLRFKQVITNLLDNAIKFTDEGSIRLGFKLLDDEKIDLIQFYVEDTGRGIETQHQQLIFDPFRQIDESLTRDFSGTGLGLSICKRLVNLMGGELKVSSEYGKGSKFYFNLPAQNAVKKIEIPEKKKISNYQWQGKTFLIAEDYDAGFELLESYLSGTEVKVIRAKNGEEAVRICNKNQNINLVLMDIQMPVMNGLEATRLIKDVYPDLPVIAQTAYALGEDETKVLKAGCDDYIAKPFKRDELLVLIHHYLG